MLWQELIWIEYITISVNYSVIKRDTTTTGNALVRCSSMKFRIFPKHCFQGISDTFMGFKHIFWLFWIHLRFKDMELKWCIPLEWKSVKLPKWLYLRLIRVVLLTFRNISDKWLNNRNIVFKLIYNCHYQCRFRLSRSSLCRYTYIDLTCADLICIDLVYVNLVF